MARRQRERQKVIRGRVPSSARNTSKSVNVSIPLSRLPRRSSEARTKALHVKAAMLRDPSLNLYPTARSFGVKPSVVKKYLGPGFTKVDGHFRANKSDRFHETMYVPGVDGNPVPIHTKSRKQRAQVSAYLRDVGRFYRGDNAALARWHGRRIAGVPLVTSSRTLKSIEAQLSDFAIYTTFNGGAE